MKIVILHENLSDAKQFAKDNNLKFTRYNSMTALDEYGNKFRLIGISEPSTFRGVRYDQIVILKGYTIEFKLDFMDAIQGELSDLVPDDFRVIVVDSRINRNYSY